MTEWPSTPLDAAQRAFELLTCPPAPLAFDCRGLDGLPQRILPLDELKTVLIDEATPRTVRDAVWRELVTRARRDGPAWVVAAVGVAMPGLVCSAGRLARGWRGDTADRDAELLAGFLARLKTVDLDEERICGRLLDAGERAVKRARAHVEESELVHIDDLVWSVPPNKPWDHPDLVLARAEAAAVISPEERTLISATRLGDAEMQQVAARLGISVDLALGWRRAAELRLVEAIRDGELEWITLLGQSAANRQARSSRTRNRRAHSNRAHRGQGRGHRAVPGRDRSPAHQHPGGVANQAVPTPVPRAG